MTAFPGRQICLVGANSLQNEVLAQFLCEKTGATCSVVSRLSSVPVETGTATGLKLVLYDFSSESETLETLMASDTRNVLSKDFLVLINLSPTRKIEISALHCGVRGFLYCHDGIDVMLKMVRAVFNSELWISRDLISKMLLDIPRKTEPAKESQHILSLREVEILQGITKGLTNDMIADTYCLSPHTVKTHISNILKKIQVSNRLQAAQWASHHL